MTTIQTKREKALELAQRTRDELGMKPLSAILLNCKTICRYLGISQENEWIDWELNGYHGLYKTQGEALEKIPRYRHVAMIFYTAYGQEIAFDHAMQEIVSTNVLEQSIAEIESFKPNGMTIKSSATFDTLNNYLENRKDFSHMTPRIAMATISANYLERIRGGVTNKINEFLDELILELEYGKIPENIFEQIRTEVDKKLVILCPKAIEKLPVIYEQLSSNKPVVYSQIASTCRTIIKDVADSLFPASYKSVIDKKGTKIKLDDMAYVNRILTPVKKHIDSEKEKFLFSSMFEYVEAFLKSINSYASKGDHAKFTKTDATRCVLYTYILLGDILHYYTKSKK